MAPSMVVGLRPYTFGHQRWNVDAIRASTSPGVLVARTRSGLLLFGTVRSMQAASVMQAARDAARRAVINRNFIEGSRRRLELEREDHRERAVLRIVVAVEAVVDVAGLGIVAAVPSPGVQIAPHHGHRCANPMVAGNAREQARRNLIL